jgi:hypothetical protein
MVLFDVYYLCHTVVQACREQGFRSAPTFKGNRSLFKLRRGWYRIRGHGGGGSSAGLFWPLAPPLLQPDE